MKPLVGHLIILLNCFVLLHGKTSEKFSCENHAYPPEKDTSIEWYIMDLDSTPEERWEHIVGNYKEELEPFIDEVLGMIGTDRRDKLNELVNNVLPLLLLKFPQSYREELEGISKTTGIALGKIVFFNIYSDLMSFCTSVVAENSQTGEHMHVRNLDFFGALMGGDSKKEHIWKISQNLRQLSINVEVRKDNEGVFNQTTFAGYVGVLTAVKSGHFSISMNARKVRRLNFEDVLTERLMDYDELYFNTWLIRDILEGQYGYEDAVTRLSNKRLFSPGYFIISGTKADEGIVITRETDENVQPVGLDVDSSRWFLLQTNYDHWVQDPLYDSRTEPGMQCMNETTPEDIDYDHMFNVLSTDPVLNRETIHTTLMDPHTGKLRSYRRYCPQCSI